VNLTEEENVHKSNRPYICLYESTPYEKKALDNINLSIETGEFVGIIGHTGSGKSTLVQHFNGLLKPTSGSVYINGEELTGQRAKELKKQVGIVFQYPEHQLLRKQCTRI